MYQNSNGELLRPVAKHHARGWASTATGPSQKQDELKHRVLVARPVSALVL
jgi:hypothetical protein